MNTIHDRIKAMRLKNQMTLLEVAEALNVKEATAQRYESGKIKDIKYETIIKLSEIFHCSPCDLLGFKDSNCSYSSNQVEHPLLQLYDSMSREEQEQLMEFLPLYSALALVDRTKIQGRVEEILESPKYSQNKKLKNA